MTIQNERMLRHRPQLNAAAARRYSPPAPGEQDPADQRRRDDPSGRSRPWLWARQGYNPCGGG